MCDRERTCLTRLRQRLNTQSRHGRPRSANYPDEVGIMIPDEVSFYAFFGIYASGKLTISRVFCVYVYLSEGIKVGNTGVALSCIS